MSIDEIFESRKNDPRWNTSYPLSPDDWAKYRVSTPLSFADDKELSFYIHIPFCKQLCSFCEYTRMICPDESSQSHYIDTLRHDILDFKSHYNNFLLKGFDIGGGTPTSLSDSNFSKLMDVFDDALLGIKLSDDFEPSIEGTFNTLSESKLRRIVHSGIERLSLGIQSTDSDVLCSHNREKPSTSVMSRWMEAAYNVGIKKINLDLMYGLKGQNAQTIESDIDTIRCLSPQQVTLYELRTNMISQKQLPSKDELYSKYLMYYNGLKELGYIAHFGQNTFSIEESDLGVSSYLRSRMTQGISYKGFGISAQSMSKQGIAYNCGKNRTNFKQLLTHNTFYEEYVYNLPASELISKYIAISGYCGSFSLDKVLEYASEDEISVIKDAIRFCQLKHFIELRDGIVQITPEGFLYYGPVLSLFYLYQ